MPSFLFIILLIIAVGGVFFGFWMRRPLSPVAKKAAYKELEEQAKAGDERALYRFAELFYEENDEKYYPLIFKWVSILASKTKDPAVWLLMGDLYSYGCGTLRDTKRGLSCYEQALAADITSGKNTTLPKEAHDYLEGQIIRLRKEVFQIK